MSVNFVDRTKASPERYQFLIWEAGANEVGCSHEMGSIQPMKSVPSGGEPVSVLLQKTYEFFFEKLTWSFDFFLFFSYYWCGDGAWPSGKATGFDPVIRRFESFRPSHRSKTFDGESLFSSEVEHRICNATAVGSIPTKGSRCGQRNWPPDDLAHFMGYCHLWCCVGIRDELDLSKATPAVRTSLATTLGTKLGTVLSADHQN